MLDLLCSGLCYWLGSAVTGQSPPAVAVQTGSFGAATAGAFVLDILGASYSSNPAVQVGIGVLSPLVLPCS